MTAERLMRVTHSERENAAERLRAAYTLGCLDEDELEERSGLAYSAKTRGELADLMMDLPAIPPGELAAGPPAHFSARDWPRLTRHALSRSCWLTVAGIGAWTISVVVSGIAAVAVIVLWLVGLRLLGLLLLRNAVQPPRPAGSARRNRTVP